MDIPSPIDFRHLAAAREWESTAMAKRPVRAEFFRRIADELSGARSPLDVLELGSGPGFLARQVLTRLPIRTYVAVDFSAVMHSLARERLGDELVSRVQFVEMDFKQPGWASGLGQCDAVMTMQAVHELRHKRHAPGFYADVRSLVRRGGVLLVCDHYVGDGGMSDAALYMTVDEHQAAMLAGGFSEAMPLMQKGGLVLLRAA